MQGGVTDASSLERQSSHALVGLLTSKLDNSSPSHRLDSDESCDNGLKEKNVRSTWLQRRGRPGIAPEFPVLSAGQTLPGQPPTPDIGSEFSRDASNFQAKKPGFSEKPDFSGQEIRAISSPKPRQAIVS